MSLLRLKSATVHPIRQDRQDQVVSCKAALFQAAADQGVSIGQNFLDFGNGVLHRLMAQWTKKAPAKTRAVHAATKGASDLSNVPDRVADEQALAAAVHLAARQLAAGIVDTQSAASTGEPIDSGGMSLRQLYLVKAIVLHAGFLNRLDDRDNPLLQCSKSRLSGRRFARLWFGVTTALHSVRPH